MLKYVQYDNSLIVKHVYKSRFLKKSCIFISHESEKYFHVPAMDFDNSTGTGRRKQCHLTEVESTRVLCAVSCHIVCLHETLATFLSGAISVGVSASLCNGVYVSKSNLLGQAWERWSLFWPHPPRSGGLDSMCLAEKVSPLQSFWSQQKCFML